MMKSPHPHQAAGAAANQGNEKERRFADAPTSFDGSALVNAHHGKTCEVDDCQIKRNKWIPYHFSFSCIFIARTLQDRPKRLMKPSASWWSYRSPVVKEAMLSLYREYGLVSPALMMLPL